MNMKARPPEYWGGKNEDLDTWIRRTECILDANEWLEDKGFTSQGGSERIG